MITTITIQARAVSLLVHTATATIQCCYYATMSVDVAKIPEYSNVQL